MEEEKFIEQNDQNNSEEEKEAESSKEQEDKPKKQANKSAKPEQSASKKDQSNSEKVRVPDPSKKTEEFFNRRKKGIPEIVVLEDSTSVSPAPTAMTSSPGAKTSLIIDKINHQTQMLESFARFNRNSITSTEWKVSH